MERGWNVVRDSVVVGRYVERWCAMVDIKYRNSEEVE